MDACDSGSLQPRATSRIPRGGRCRRIDARDARSPLEPFDLTKETAMKNAALYIALALLAAACANKEVQKDAAVTDRSSSVPNANAGTGSSSATTRPNTADAVRGNPLT